MSDTATIADAPAAPAGESLLAAGADTSAATTTTAAPTGAAADGATTSATTADAGATTEGKPEGGETAAEGAPDTYADFTLPEGVALGTDLATEFGGLAKGLNLTQEQAQQVLDIGAKLALKGAADQVATIQTVQETWRNETRTDKEFGGDKLPENLARAKAAMEATSTPQLQVLLDKSGLGNHPEVIRHFLKVAPAFLPDGWVPGGKAPQTSKGAQSIYAASNMNP